MKTSAVLLPLLSALSSASGQGQINFANFWNGVDAPITNSAGGRILGPSTYVAGFFWSSNTQATAHDLVPAGSSTGFSGLYGGGYFFGGGITLPVWEVPVLAQIRAWDTSYAPTYAEARDRGGEFGYSNPLLVTPSVPPGTATALTALKGFQLQRLPSLAVSLTATNRLLLSWPVTPATYALQQNPALNSGNWATLNITPVIVGAQNQVTLPVPAGIMFYRLVSHDVP